uniref:Patronin, isoform N n=1 Tax=Drosophila melanogaster TaxID=7227 RepID=A0A0B4KEY6_DROME|nr:patronin, isoform N [Drosophila melanogaster]AGB93588.1 patronin, isoform N [Drosophila melanogaster]|eukprot:NP_001261056.1 patronin, isoform N [Drosophila melanogaster]
MDVETQEIRQARQRASVKWLLSKAFNNRVPDNLKEPFYRDHENQERLKPQIIVELGNATLYCQTLANLYSDPNYQSMNHWSIIQTLARKGVPVAESADMPITETVLIQTNPLRINAHMSVIESLMVLYAKEISSGDRVMAAIRRISGNNYQAPTGQSYEQALLGWISHACAALKKRIIKEVDAGLPDDNTPDIPPVRDFQDLCDGICLALLISYYCPKVVPWTSVRINYLPAVEDSIHNILLVCNFSQKHLPYTVMHMTPEDVTYMRGSMKLNLVVLLTDLFNLFEIHPAKCVCYPGMDGQGRRSRRNSSSEDSQLTIENFGGSQDQLNTLGRYERDRERKLSNTSVGSYPVEPAVAVRSSIADARGTLQLGYDTDSGSEKQDRETEKYSMRRQVSVDNVPTVSSHNLSNAGSPLPVARHKQHSSDKDYSSNSGMTPDAYNDSRSTSGYDPESTPVRKSSTSSMPASPAAWQLDVGDDDMRSLENASKLSTIRMKLEEKRRRIEQDKRKIEMALLRHQEKDLESCPDVMKWETMSNESKRTPDMDPVDLDKYQAYNAPVSAYSSRPPSRDPYQQQLHHQQQQPMPMPQPMQYVNEHGQYMSPPQPAHYMPQQAQQPQSIYSDNGAAYNHSNHSPYGGTPQYRSSVVYDDYGQPTNHFYLHESSPQPQAHQHPQRRTWAHSAAAAAYEQQQQIQPSLVDVNAWQTQQHQKQKQTWMNRPPSSAGAPSPGSFMLHQNGGGGGGGGGGGELQHLFQVQASPQHGQRQVSGSNGVQRQQSLTNLRDNRSPKAPQNMGMPMGMPMQQEDMMAPQSICFIGDEEDVDELERNIIESMQSTHISDFVHQQQQQHQHQQQLQQQQRLQGHSGRGSSSEDYDSGEMISNKLNITSGNLTYRIPSPSRPSIQANSFQDPRAMAAASGGEDQPPEKGFYISFDDEQPKRPKPPLRAKRSPKKESPPGSRDSVDNQATLKRESLSHLHNNNNIGFGNDDVNSKPVTRHSIHGLNNSNSVKSPGNATYNKYTDEPPIQLRQLAVSGAMSPTSNERHHLDDVSNQSPQQTQQPMSPTRLQQSSNNAEAAKNKALVIGADSTNLDPESVDEMERRKEKIMLLSLQRRQQQEEAKARKEIEASQKREKEREKEEERARKKEEQMARRAAILEQHRLKKAIEEAEREGKTLDRPDLHVKLQSHSSTSTTPRLRQQRTTRPRPKTIHVDDASVDISEASSISSRGKKGSSSNLTEPAGVERGRTLSRISVAKGSTLNFRGRKSNSLMNLCDTDSGLGRATPPRRAPSPGMGMGASGPKLYKQPAAKSNRGIILNAVEYCVFPGVVNREAKQKVLEKIARSEAKHFLVLFRDAGCQFRALYSYQPETDQVTKLYGTGPSQVEEVMFDKFFKYNSGGKCFSQVHTKHLTVTIDAFTIHNSLWQGKRVQLPSKKDMALVI